VTGSASFLAAGNYVLVLAVQVVISSIPFSSTFSHIFLSTTHNGQPSQDTI